MNNVVLDASAVLALLNDEIGAKIVQESLPGAIISSVNFAEVVTRLTLLGMPEKEIREALDILALDITPFGEEQAFLAGILAIKTKQLGLSLGDRACLALALKTGSTALTADKVWQALDIGVIVRVIR
jgi:PIN domain nuclease of toxin-antitoxin system